MCVEDNIYCEGVNVSQQQVAKNPIKTEYSRHFERVNTKIKKYITYYEKVFGKSPTVGEIMAATKIRTKRTVEKYINIGGERR